jgi:DNA polymerase-1
MLGAIYGATTGASAVLMPQLTRAYPRAVGLVEQAARAGERGEVVSTWLGRTSPAPDAEWQAARQAAVTEGADAEEVRAARRRGRDWGRFTRNFVVQGTAAEWALCWMAALRRRLLALDLPDAPDAQGATGGVGRPHLVFFLHDEVIVHSPAEVADQVVEAVRDAATEAGQLLFGDTPVDFALTVSVVDSYDQAK